MKKIVIITVTFNESHNLKIFFDSIKSQTYKNIDVIVIDNNSNDGCVEKAIELFPSVIIIQNESNIGFSAAINTGYQKAKKLDADYIFILNNDVKFNDTCIEELWKLAEKSDASIVGPILFEWHDDNIENIIQEYGGNINKNTGQKVKYYRRKIFFENEIPEQKEVTFIGGGVSFINMTKVKEKDYIFDTDYFLYTEEQDFETDLVRNGHKMYVTTKAKVWHKVHERNLGQKYRELFYITRNTYLYFYKYFGLRKAVKYFVIQMFKFPRTAYQLNKRFGFKMVYNVFIANWIGLLIIKGKINFKYLYKKY